MCSDLSRARRSFGMAAGSLLLQSSPLRCCIQMSLSTAAGPYTCFRSLGQGEGLIATSVTFPKTTRFAYVRSKKAA